MVETHTETITIPNWQWSTDCAMSLFFMVINMSILKKEYNKRLSTKITFASPYIKSFPLLCMICGVLVEIAIQGIFMGFFQLSRLYYCFSSSNVHSTKGYSKSVFIFMYAIGALIMCTLLLASWFYQRIEYCTIDDEFNYIEISTHMRDFTNIIVDVFVGCVFTYMLWDFTTLSLYIFKLISFSRFKKDIKVYQRIKGILMKIIILTMVYEIAVIFLSFDALIEVLSRSEVVEVDSVFVLVLFEGLVSTTMSYSIFIMQQHNTDEYKQFLYVIHYIKMDLIFCCCKSHVTYELGLDEEPMSTHINNVNATCKADVNKNNININEAKNHKNDSLNVKNQIEVTATGISGYTTHDISSDHGKVHFSQNTVSIETIPESNS
eukprot:241661_1